MNWLRSEDLKEEKNVTTPTSDYSRSGWHAALCNQSSCSAGKIPNLICIDQSAFRFWPTLLMTLDSKGGAYG